MEPHGIIKGIVNDLCYSTGTKKKHWAEKCGYNQKTFSLLLNGHKLITYTDVVKLCKGLGKEPNDLFDIVFHT